MKLKQKYLIFVLSILGLLVVAFGVYHLQKSKEASLKAPVPSAIVRECTALAQDGEHPEILKAHVQFHESVLKSDQTLQEIGFPQNLEKWFELGKEYPKALEALRETRNRGYIVVDGGRPGRACTMWFDSSIYSWKSETRMSNCSNGLRR